MPWTRIGRSTSTMPWSKSMNIARSAITHCSPIADLLVGGDRALLAQHGLRTDRDLALVAADLRAVADPDEAPEADRARACRSRARRLRPKKTGPSVSQRHPARREVAPPQIAPQQARVAGVQHVVGGEEAQRADQGAWSLVTAAPRLPRPMAERRSKPRSPLAERVLAGEGRALARAISLVENRDPAGDELVAELYPRTGKAADHRPDRPARRRQEHPDRRAHGGRCGRTGARSACSRSTRRARSRRAPCWATGSACPITSSTRACSSARWPPAARSAAWPRRRCRRRS